METKFCNKCKTNKQLSEFWKDKRNKDGYQRLCKDCKREGIRKWRKSPAGKAWRKSQYKKYPQHKDDFYNYKYHVRGVMLYAVKLGYIKKDYICSVCNIDTLKEGKIINGHHDDYLKPLTVRWVCTFCHSQIHIAIKKKCCAFFKGDSL